LFNIGAEGQMTAGGLAAALVGVWLKDLPAIVLVPVCLAAAAAGGVLVALVPALLRAYRGVHEVISTIMMNFIAAAAAGAVMQHAAVAATVRTEELPAAAHLPRLSAIADALGMASLGDALRPSPANAAVVLALLAAIAVALYLFRSVGGFELRVLGLNPSAAATGGIDVRRATMRAFVLSGALAGLAGVSFVMGAKYYYETGFASGAGFMGIAVALLGRNHPLGVVLAALLFGTLAHGGLVVNARISSEIVNVLQALVILFLIAGLARRAAPARRESAEPDAPKPAEAPV
ncbi:MAG TPA: ABC transporter permease, partial [bacterium]|nr:ABC transporter permease [bacterium]